MRWQPVVVWLAQCVLVVMSEVKSGDKGDKGPASTAMPTATFHLGDPAGTPHPDILKEANHLLSEFEHAGVTVHFMPQKVENPDCHVVTFVEKRHGGRCSRMAGGMPFCAVKNYVFPNHPDCLDTEPGSTEERPWASPQWFVRMATPGMETTTEQSPEDGDTTAADTTEAPPNSSRRQIINPPSGDVTQPEVSPTEGARSARRRGGRGRRPHGFAGIGRVGR